tara:strand:- start:325 stop:537 length:213 start_codon:yes stop_codon:yes gene_type:complete
MLDPNNAEDLNSISKSRDITQEILNFGVNQNEILKIIELLSFELENVFIMKEISKILKPEQIEKKVLIER